MIDFGAGRSAVVEVGKEGKAWTGSLWQLCGNVVRGGKGLL